MEQKGEKWENERQKKRQNWSQRRFLLATFEIAVLEFWRINFFEDKIAVLTRSFALELSNKNISMCTNSFYIRPFIFSIGNFYVSQQKSYRLWLGHLPSAWFSPFNFSLQQVFVHNCARKYYIAFICGKVLPDNKNLFSLTGIVDSISQG